MRSKVFDSLIGTIVFFYVGIARGFDPQGGFPLVRRFAIGHNVYMPMLRFRHRIVSSREGVSAKLAAK